jgi:hypothetical protein
LRLPLALIRARGDNNGINLVGRYHFHGLLHSTVNQLVKLWSFFEKLWPPAPLLRFLLLSLESVVAASRLLPDPKPR